MLPYAQILSNTLAEEHSQLDYVQASTTHLLRSSASLLTCPPCVSFSIIWAFDCCAITLIFHHFLARHHQLLPGANSYLPP